VTVREVLAKSASFLAARGSASPRLDAELLTTLALGLRRLDLYLDPDRLLSTVEADRLRALVVRRGKGEPVAYIRGTREFFGLAFAVTPAVLIPRPETEVLVDAVLARVKDRPARVADVGTGSGAIACAVAAHAPGVRVEATDVSPAAIEVAIRNADALGVADRVRMVVGDLLDGTEGDFDVVASNPPYVAEDEAALVDRSARDFEPAGALFAGPDGMSVTARLVAAAVPRLVPGGALIVEVGTPAQAARVEALLRSHDGLEQVRPLPDAARVVRGFEALRRDVPAREDCG
jgi:release factor glutamine methyltransferase